MDFILRCVCVCVCAQSCLTLCNPMDCSASGSSVLRFFKEEYWSRLLFPTLGNLLDPGIKPRSCVSCISKQILYSQHHLAAVANYCKGRGCYTNLLSNDSGCQKAKLIELTGLHFFQTLQKIVLLPFLISRDCSHTLAHGPFFTFLRTSSCFHAPIYYSCYSPLTLL